MAARVKFLVCKGGRNGIWTSSHLLMPVRNTGSRSIGHAGRIPSRVQRSRAMLGVRSPARVDVLRSNDLLLTLRLHSGGVTLASTLPACATATSTSVASPSSIEITSTTSSTLITTTSSSSTSPAANGISTTSAQRPTSAAVSSPSRSDSHSELAQHSPCTLNMT